MLWLGPPKLRNTFLKKSQSAFEWPLFSGEPLFLGLELGLESLELGLDSEPEDTRGLLLFFGGDLAGGVSNLDASSGSFDSSGFNFSLLNDASIFCI